MPPGLINLRGAQAMDGDTHDFLEGVQHCFGLCVAQAADIRRISLEGKEGMPASVTEPGKDGINCMHSLTV
jgi:hypothetical protein